MWFRRTRSDGVRSVVGLAAVAMLAISGCDVGNGGGDEGTPEVIDPALQAAAEAIEPELRENFGEVFAGLKLDHDSGTLEVYRIPDDSLEARVRDLVDDVTIEFHDADYSWKQMQAVVEQVIEDRQYWEGQSIDVTAAAMEVDGSGIAVYVVEASEEATVQIRQRYDPMPVSVKEGDVQPPIYTDPVPTISVTSDELETEREVIEGTVGTDS